MFSYAFFSLAVIETHCEQRMEVKSCFKNELTATETFKMLQKAYSNEYLPCTNIFEWYGEFRNDRESMFDDVRAGRPLTSRTLEHIAKVHATLAENQCSMIKMLDEWFHIDIETMRKIITEDLGGKYRVRDLFPIC